MFDASERFFSSSAGLFNSTSTNLTTRVFDVRVSFSGGLVSGHFLGVECIPKHFLRSSCFILSYSGLGAIRHVHKLRNEVFEILSVFVAGGFSLRPLFQSSLDAGLINSAVRASLRCSDSLRRRKILLIDNLLVDDGTLGVLGANDFIAFGASHTDGLADSSANVAALRERVHDSVDASTVVRNDNTLPRYATEEDHTPAIGIVSLFLRDDLTLGNVDPEVL